MVKLSAVIEVDGQESKTLEFERESTEVLLGRDAANDFQIPLTTVSRQHARLFCDEDYQWFLEDLNSTHGTQLNGKKLTSGEKKLLRDGDVIALSKARVTFSTGITQFLDRAPGEKTEALALRAVEDILGKLGESDMQSQFLRVMNGPDEGQKLELSGAMMECYLGRSRECDLVLNDPNVSRQHALVKKDWNGTTIQDLGSKNGVIVNDVKISGAKPLKDRVSRMLIDSGLDGSVAPLIGFDSAMIDGYHLHALTPQNSS